MANDWYTPQPLSGSLTTGGGGSLVGRSSGEHLCTSCGKGAPEVGFKRRGKSGRQAGTLHAMCNRCLYVKFTRPAAMAKTALVHQFKLEAGCADCGFAEHPAALQFDHRPGTDKKFNIGEKVGSYSMDKIWAEIAKCDVVCANCHVIRTVERRVYVE